jgi:chemotaxis signal transduction protein
MSTALLTFRWGDACFAVPLEGVREVVRLSDLVPIPGALAPLVGLLDVRGEPLRVMDLRPLMLPLLPAQVRPEGGEFGPEDARDVLVVTDPSGQPVGIICDEVIGVDDTADTTPVVGLPAFVLGVLPGPVPILDVAGILTVTGTGLRPAEAPPDRPAPARRATLRPVTAKTPARRASRRPSPAAEPPAGAAAEEPGAAAEEPGAAEVSGWRRVRVDDWGT